ncbi:hypothetical protein NST17_20190 [Caldifermentibacillus hisashii]|uniref:DUF1828 domain-containing protein n=1 Tax=Caldifermentibacillus hisashii TaxID=996558 RepID=A0ABU9K357_9BACI
MAEAKFVIRNGERNVCVVWELNGKDIIIFDKDIKIDFENDLELFNVNSRNSYYIDLLDIITKSLNNLTIKDHASITATTILST